MSHERLTAILRTMVETVSEPTPPRGEQDLAEWLTRKELADGDQRAFGGVGASRLFLYRTLVRRGLRNAIREEIPRTASRLGEARFEEEVNRFVSEEMPQSHYLRDVPVEMVEWAAPRWSSDPTLPPFLSDLARHELSAFEVAGADAAPQDVEPELRLDLPVVLDPAARVRRYGFPIHLLGDDDQELAPKPTTLLVYRDAEHDVRYLELTPLAGLIVDHLLAKDPLGAAITKACVALAVGFPVEESARFFADLAERGVLLGAAKAEH